MVTCRSQEFAAVDSIVMFEFLLFIDMPGSSLKSEIVAGPMCLATSVFNLGTRNLFSLN